MLAAQLVAPGRFVVVEVDPPQPGEGEVLVAMERASICGSDLHAIDRADPRPGRLEPGAPGHEGLGRVLESNSARFAPGERVLTVPLPGAGRCFAEQQVVGADFLVRLPGDGDPARFVLAQQLGTAVFAFRRYWPAGRDAHGATAAVLGAGSAGLFLLQLARRAGFGTLVACDLDEHRLEVAAALGADVVVRAPAEDFAATVHRVTGGAGAELVIEATGFDRSRAACIEAVRQAGRLGFFGLPERHGDAPFPLERAFRRACTIEMAGSAQLDAGLSCFEEAVGLIASGAIEVGSMLAPSFPLRAFPEAFAAARAQRGVKVAIELAGEAPQPA